MHTYLYLSMTPESLVASMLPPEEFGRYLAVGSRKSAHGRAMFFDLHPGFESTEFDLEYAAKRCVPHPDGRPKNSLYLSIYRVLERVPLAAINNLWLATEHGKVLELQASSELPVFTDSYYLYQELCPFHPLIASKLSPPDFTRFVTEPNKPLFMPKLCFLDIDLGELATDPEQGRPNELYYPDHYWHLRGCLLELKASSTKDTKTVDRLHPQHFPYHCIKQGFYLGDQTGIRFYRFPSRDELVSKHYDWWRSSHH